MARLVVAIRRESAESPAWDSDQKARCVKGLQPRPRAADLARQSRPLIASSVRGSLCKDMEPLDTMAVRFPAAEDVRRRYAMSRSKPRMVARHAKVHCRKRKNATSSLVLRWQLSIARGLTGALGAIVMSAGQLAKGLELARSRQDRGTEANPVNCKQPKKSRSVGAVVRGCIAHGRIGRHGVLATLNVGMHRKAAGVTWKVPPTHQDQNLHPRLTSL